MLPLPRLAVGTVQADVDQTMVLWALIEAMRFKGLQVQSFHGQACFSQHCGTATACGVSPRHLDSWLMSSERCRELLVHGSENADLALVDGKYSSTVTNGETIGGRLDELCEWLDLPRLAVIDVPQAVAEGLPSLPPQVDALLLDRVAEGVEAAEWRERLQSLWGIPVLGGLETIEPLRAELASVPDGVRPPKDACQLLGSFFLRLTQTERLLELGYRRKVDWSVAPPYSQAPELPPLVVALAFDSALDCYFPDTLDLLEARGATLVDFSLLNDERLPDHCDVVYLGCGYPERFGDELSHNHCMKLALRSHVCNGGRLYAEGGGLAYLCQQIELPDGRHKRMAGIFPAIARLQESAGEPEAEEAVLERDAWLGAAGSRVRGYRSSRWDLRPVESSPEDAADSEIDESLLVVGGAIGSRLYLDFATQPKRILPFFEPVTATGDSDDPWKAAS